MIIIKSIVLTIGLLAVAYVTLGFILSERNARCQKLWDKEKAMRIRNNPSISRAELCEYYVMFTLRNNCKVDF